MEDLQFNETILYLNAEFVQMYITNTDIRCGTRFFVHPFISGNLSTNHDIETKHAPAVLVTIYKTLRKELWLLKRAVFAVL